MRRPASLADWRCKARAGKCLRLVTKSPKELRSRPQFEGTMRTIVATGLLGAPTAAPIHARAAENGQVAAVLRHARATRVEQLQVPGCARSFQACD